METVTFLSIVVIEWFYFGDVVGKGPSAALATACVCTTLTSCFNDKKTVEESICAINQALLSVFKGKMSSTLAVVEVMGEGRARIFNHGNVGWFLRTLEKCIFLPLVNSMLGKQSDIIISFKEVELSTNDSLISMTDGILEGSRAIKSFVKTIESKGEGITQLGDYLDIAREIGKTHVLEDDQTFVAISRC